MIELIPMTVLYGKTQELKTHKLRSGESATGASVFGSFWLVFMILYLVVYWFVFYKNIIFIMKCVKSDMRIIHIAITFLFNWVYLLYRLFIADKCKY